MSVRAGGFGSCHRERSETERGDLFFPFISEIATDFFKILAMTESSVIPHLMRDPCSYGFCGSCGFCHPELDSGSSFSVILNVLYFLLFLLLLDFLGIDSLRNPLLKDFFPQGFVFLCIQSSFVHMREEIPMMLKLRITWKLEKCIEVNFECLYFFSRIGCDFLCFLTIPRDEIVNIHHHMRCAIKSKPELPVIWCISGFFPELSFCTLKWILVWDIKPSSW